MGAEITRVHLYSLQQLITGLSLQLQTHKNWPPYKIQKSEVLLAAQLVEQVDHQVQPIICLSSPP